MLYFQKKVSVKFVNNRWQLKSLGSNIPHICIVHVSGIISIVLCVWKKVHFVQSWNYLNQAIYQFSFLFRKFSNKFRNNLNF